MDEDRVEIPLVNDLNELSGVAERIDAFCSARELAPDIAFSVNLAVEELLTNIVSYGYNDEAVHRIEIALRREGETLVITIVDDSAAFDPTDAPEPDTEAPLEDREPGGLGLFLVHQTMDGVAYHREDGRNVTTLTKDLAGKE